MSPLQTYGSYEVDMRFVGQNNLRRVLIGSKIFARIGQAIPPPPSGNYLLEGTGDYLLEGTGSYVLDDG